MRVLVAVVLAVVLASPAAAQPAPADHGTGTHEECATYGCLYSHDVPFVRPGRPQPERPLGIAWSRLPDGPDGRRFERVLWPSGYDPGRRAMWDRVAYCESTWRWDIASGNGFYGGLQAHPATWRAFGGEEFAAMAHLALPEQQIAWGERVAFTGFGPYRPQGPGAWPVCGRHLRPP